jgi:hypothetical protein
LRAFENRLLIRICGPKKDEMIRGWRKLHDEIHNLYSSPDIISMVKYTRMRCVGNVECMGEIRNSYKIYTGKPGCDNLEYFWHRWEDSVKQVLRKCGGCVWTVFMWLRLVTHGRQL